MNRILMRRVDKRSTRIQSACQKRSGSDHFATSSIKFKDMAVLLFEDGIIQRIA